MHKRGIFAEISAGSIVFLLPDPDIFGKKVFLTTPTSNYTAENFPRLLRDANLPPSTLDTLRAVRPFQKMSAPGVRVNCVFGTDVQTEATYNSENFGGKWTVSMEKGDGTCLDKALRSCQVRYLNMLS